jgi:hypothetical protein
MTYDGYHFGQLGTMFNLSLNYKFNQNIFNKRDILMSLLFDIENKNPDL